jgi:type I restriction enzyme S subunit
MSEQLMLALAEQDVPQGYKKTEVGVIPEDWGVGCLEELVVYRNGAAHESCVDNNGSYTLVNSRFISTQGAVRKNSSECRQPAYYADVLMVMSDVPNGRAIAKCYWVEADDTYTVNQRICALKSMDVDSRYLFYKLNRNPFYLAFDDGAKQTNLRRQDVLDCPLPLPPKPEQTAIATALSNVDALITELEKLIAKKQAIKTATMQQLLTGRTRLPQFALRDDGTPKGYKASELGEIPEDWEVKTLGEVAKINMGQSPNSSFYNNKAIGFPLVQGNADIANRKTIVRNYTSQVTKMAKKGDLILSVRAPVGEVAKADFDCCIGRGVCALGYKNAYLYHWLVGFEAEWDKFSKGSTFDSINSDELRLIQLILPSFEEQTAIATILSDMDSDSDRLQQQLSKTRQIKQGMMQELLTGKTRLKV